jgi:hypothetical protein
MGSTANFVAAQADVDARMGAAAGPGWLPSSELLAARQTCQSWPRLGLGPLTASPSTIADPTSPGMLLLPLLKEPVSRGAVVGPLPSEEPPWASYTSTAEDKSGCPSHHSKGPISKPRAAVRPWSREPLFLPDFVEKVEKSSLTKTR